MKINNFAAAMCFAAAAPVTHAFDDLNVSAVINMGYTDRQEFQGIGEFAVDEHAKGLSQGFWTDHTELAFSAPIDDMFYGKVAVVLDEDAGETVVELEEAFVQTMALDYGLGMRFGRFLSNIGYLNNKHAHNDSFADRPLVYRAFLNDHYYDDGVRATWLAPTDIYMEFGAELFKGGTMPAYSDGSGIGAKTAFIKLGGDFNVENSWQLGASYLAVDNDEGACSAHSHGDEEHHDEELHDESTIMEEEHHAIGVCDFVGSKQTYMLDAVWKWAPNGNYKYQYLTLSAEYFWLQEDGEIHSEEDVEAHAEDEHEEHLFANGNHQGYYASAVYQFTPNWALGLRYSEIDFEEPYSDGFKPSVSTAMIEYRHSHFSTIRLQYNQDKSVEDLTDDQLTIQFSMVLGAHSAHQF